MSVDLPADLVRLRAYPNYGITPIGDVWRWWPRTRKLKPIWCGCQLSRSLHVHLQIGLGRHTSKSIAALMREHFPCESANAGGANGSKKRPKIVKLGTVAKGRRPGALRARRFGPR